MYVKKYKKSFVKKGPTRGKKHYHKRHHASTTKLLFKPSKSIHQPLPDRYFTWLEQNNSGYITAAAAAFSVFGLCLNGAAAQFPFNISVGLGTIPNGLPAVASAAATGHTNLFTIYKYCRIWGVKVSVTMVPQSQSDSGQLVMAPFVDATYAATVAGILQAAQAPGSVVRLINSSAPMSTNTVRKYYSIPELLGISKKDYAIGSNGSFQNGSPVTGPIASLFVGYRTLDQANTSTPVGIEVQCNWLVEMFMRNDSTLSIT